MSGYLRSPSGRECRGTGGFTIIEVMVAILLLSVSLVSIFGAQFSAVSSAEYSLHVTQAVELARCRMSELELQFQVEDGFQEGDVSGSGECCEVVEGMSSTAPYTCRWEIKTIELPDITQLMANGGADGGMMGDLMGGMGDMGGAEEDMEDMGMGMIAQFLPMVTELLQQAIRRVTVTVEWDQGSRHRDLEIVQYVVHPTQGPLQLMQQASAMEQLGESMGLDTGDDTGRDRGASSGQPRNGRGAQGVKKAINGVSDGF